MKIMILALSMITMSAVAMNICTNSSFVIKSNVCEDPFAEAKMFLLLRDVTVCNHYAEHPGCQQLKASLSLYHANLCNNPSDWAMQDICDTAKVELFEKTKKQLIEDHNACEETAKKCALLLLQCENR
jgi:hypothetical protein